MKVLDKNKDRQKLFVVLWKHTTVKISGTSAATLFLIKLSKFEARRINALSNNCFCLCSGNKLLLFRVKYLLCYREIFSQTSFKFN